MKRVLEDINKNTLILAIILTLLMIGCGGTSVRNLKPPPLTEKPVSMYPMRVAMVVPQELLEYKVTLEYLEGDQILIYRSIPNFFMQSLMTHFEQVDAVSTREEIDPDRFDLTAGMSIAYFRRELSAISSGPVMLFKLSLETVDGTGVLHEEIEAPGQVFATLPYGQSDEAASRAVWEVFKEFGKRLEASEKLKTLSSQR